MLADAFPMREAMEKWKDASGRYFYEKDYQEQGWEEVSLPHTFNDADLFVAPIQGSGSGQKRTCAFYRKVFFADGEWQDGKIFLEFEGIRQTCYLYVNGQMAGYYEAGVAPFGFDLTPYVKYGEDNLIALVTDNTASRNIRFCIAETPNAPEAEPGSFLLAQDEAVPEERRSVGFSWNCNDFNPSVGGITRPVYLHVKPPIYLTLPLYSNLQTKGMYVYGSNYDTQRGMARIHVEAELRNESKQRAMAELRVTIEQLDGSCVHTFSSELLFLAAGSPVIPPRSITPPDAYQKEPSGDGKWHYVPGKEEEAAPTGTDSVQTTKITAVSNIIPIRFWDIDDPYLYRIRAELFVNGIAVDSEVIETGFREVKYDKDKGILLNGRSVWLTGYAQRASNEWAAIGIAPEWLKDQDILWLKESNSNHIRWMHVAASPSDIRSCDRHGVVCTQPAGDKESDSSGRQWDQRVELMRDIIIAFRNHPSILFWEAGNNSISQRHMEEMTKLKRALDPKGGRFMGCRTINTEEVVAESEYVGTMLNRHAARPLAEHGPVTETEYSREEAPRRVWDDFSPPDFDYRNRFIGKGGKMQEGCDFWDLTMEELILAQARGYSEFFHDRIGGASGKNLYSAAAALCWTDSAQHGRQSGSENGRMSGRVDPVRIRKQNFYLYQVMQSQTPMVKIIGHWNYPVRQEDYIYPLKEFNGEYWEETGRYACRNPKKKTVYVAGSYSVLRTELWVNGEKAGSSEKTVHGFLFPFEDIDITRQGRVEAVGFDEGGREVARDCLCTAGEPARLRMTLHTSQQGFLADGADIAYLDVEVLDSEGRLCPLCDSRIDFETKGEARFLGGYNSGRFQGFGRADSVIHQNYVYAECGLNRVFLRSTFSAGKVSVKAVLAGVPDVVVEWESIAVERKPLSLNPPNVRYEKYPERAPERKDAFPAIPAADARKYQAQEENRCKILVCGQEPDNGRVPGEVPCVNKNGSIWGPVLFILDQMRWSWGDMFCYEFEPEMGRLVVRSGENTIMAEVGNTNLRFNQQEILMDGAPYRTEQGIFVMEVNALVPHIQNVRCQYDDRMQMLRIDLKCIDGD